MNIIKTLPPHVANLIAAGEVVERPASIIKELMENCVDAGADSITVEIKNGGIDSITITDNGCGMSREDACACFIRHATSKISTQSDLSAILTLGFRGEALAAISAVSKIELRTRQPDSMLGTRVICESGKILSVEDDGGPVGTSITVREIFFNTPARMKFLKKNSTEASYCAASVDHIALSHPEIAVRFIKDGRVSMRTPGDGKALSAILGVCGRDFVDSLIPVPEDESQTVLSSRLKIWGYITRPERALSGRGSQYFILNGRHIHSKTLTAALEEAYRGSIMTGKYPGCVLYAAIDPEHVDVNVHPAKLEIKFSDERAAFQSVYEAVKRAFAASERPKFTASAVKPEAAAKSEIPAKPETPVKETHYSVFDYSLSPAKDNDHVLRSDQPILGAYKSSSAHTPSIDISAEDFDMGPFSEKPSEGIPAEPPKESEPYIEEASASETEEGAPEIKPLPDVTQESIFLDELLPTDTPADDIAAKEAVREETDVREEIPSLPPYRIIGEAFNSYIIVELEDELMYIDKHAAHERILYNKLTASTEPPPGQLLLTPLILPVSHDDMAVIEENAEELSRLGLDFADFGGGNIIISSVPAYIEAEDTADFIEEVCLRMKKNENDNRRENILHSIACKAAIKAGWITSPQEIDALARQVLSDDMLRYCPHGRPVALTLRRRDFEKEFFRT